VKRCWEPWRWRQVMLRSWQANGAFGCAGDSKVAQIVDFDCTNMQADEGLQHIYGVVRFTQHRTAPVMFSAADAVNEAGGRTGARGASPSASSADGPRAPPPTEVAATAAAAAAPAAAPRCCWLLPWWCASGGCSWPETLRPPGTAARRLRQRVGTCLARSLLLRACTARCGSTCWHHEARAGSAAASERGGWCGGAMPCCRAPVAVSSPPRL
jgi:hypothetical protein